MPVNIKNPAIKRIHADVRELMKDPSDQYHAAPLESNLFEWHFTIRGPPETEFEGGVYHGRIILPPEYPFRPPDIIFNTPNGRFSTGMKVCLTISSYHPEHWQPAWGIRLILEALISFFPSPSQGALGGLDWSAEERKRLVAESIGWKCYKCGVANDLLPDLRPKGDGGAGAGASSSYADQIKALHKLKAKTAEEIAAESPAAAGTAAADAAGGGGGDGGGGDGGVREGTASDAPSREGGGIGVVSEAAVSSTDLSSSERSEETTAVSEVTAVVAPSSPRLSSAGGAPAEGGDDSTSSPAAAAAAGDASTVSMGGAGELGGDREQQQQQEEEAVVVDTSTPEREDDVLSFFAVAIALAIVGILIRKALRLLDVF